MLAKLAKRRPVFHSEADFQHALAWELQLADPTSQIFLEKQVAVDGPRVHLDLLVRGTGHELAIELKYKTRAVKWTHADEVFSLRNQSAQDIGRHDFIKDWKSMSRLAHVLKVTRSFVNGGWKRQLLFLMASTRFRFTGIHSN